MLSWKLFKPSFAINHDTRKLTRSARKFNCRHGYLTGLLLLCGDIASHPGPVISRSPTAIINSVKCLLLNARSLKSFNRDVVTNKTIYNLNRFQDLVYAESSDVVCVNETWLNKDILDSEILHSDYTIFRKDRVNRSGGGVLLAVKAESFQTVREFPVPADMDRLQLEIVAAELTTESNHKILFCSCYKPPDVNISWSDEFNDFLNNICDQYDNLLIVGDFNLPNISWDSNNNAFGANEMSFVDALHDHYLSQIINIPTRGSNILDLVITSVQDHVSVTEVLSPDKAALFTDHNVITFEYAVHLKAPSKTLRYIYDYNNGDFNGLRTAIHEKDLSSLVTSDDNDDINGLFTWR
jgi:exonuclease III